MHTNIYDCIYLSIYTYTSIGIYTHTHTHLYSWIHAHLLRITSEDPTVSRELFLDPGLRPLGVEEVEWIPRGGLTAGEPNGS